MPKAAELNDCKSASDLVRLLSSCRVKLHDFQEVVAMAPLPSLEQKNGTVLGYKAAFRSCKKEKQVTRLVVTNL